LKEREREGVCVWCEVRGSEVVVESLAIYVRAFS